MGNHAKTLIQQAKLNPCLSTQEVLSHGRSASDGHSKPQSTMIMMMMMMMMDSVASQLNRQSDPFRRQQGRRGGRDRGRGRLNGEAPAASLGTIAPPTARDSQASAVHSGTHNDPLVGGARPLQLLQQEGAQVLPRWMTFVLQPHAVPGFRLCSPPPQDSVAFFEAPFVLASSLPQYSCTSSLLRTITINIYYSYLLQVLVFWRLSTMTIYDSLSLCRIYDCYC